MNGLRNRISHAVYRLNPDDNNDLADQLSQLTVFSGIPPQELTWLASHGTLRKLCAGETFAAQGVPVETMWVVLSGLTILSQFCPTLSSQNTSFRLIRRVTFAVSE